MAPLCLRGRFPLRKAAPTFDLLPVLAACPPLQEERNCNKNACAINCVHTFSPWGDCSASCGGGTQLRRAIVQTAAAFGGKQCPGSEERVCNRQSCPTPAPTPAPTTAPTAPPTPAPTNAPTAAPTPAPVDCVPMAWSAWTKCSTDCGPGLQYRKRSVDVAALHGGKPCAEMKQARECKLKECPVHCKHNWSNWGACSATCGGGE